MIESNIQAGKQDVPPGPDGASKLKRGVSITDACVDFEMTVEMLDGLNKVRILHSKILCDMLLTLPF